MQLHATIKQIITAEDNGGGIGRDDGVFGIEVAA